MRHRQLSYDQNEQLDAPLTLAELSEALNKWQTINLQVLMDLQLTFTKFSGQT